MKKKNIIVTMFTVIALGTTHYLSANLLGDIGDAVGGAIEGTGRVAEDVVTLGHAHREERPVEERLQEAKEAPLPPSIVEEENEYTGVKELFAEPETKETSMMKKQDKPRRRWAIYGQEQPGEAPQPKRLRR